MVEGSAGHTDNQAGGPKDWYEWASLYATRNEIAADYAVLLIRRPFTWVGWPKVNRAIADRWSHSGLQYVKRRAWKLVEQSGLSDG